MTKWDGRHGFGRVGSRLRGCLLRADDATTTRQFEVISVDGNQLVFRDERGTNQITVPEGFRFTVDGKQLAIGDLKPGMKGTAAVTTTTTVTPVTLTEIKKGVVVGVGPDSLTVKDEADGVRKRFTQAQLNDRGIKLVNQDGRVTYARDAKQGDAITAIIVSQAPPVVVTEQEVQATLAQASPTATATSGRGRRPRPHRPWPRQRRRQQPHPRWRRRPPRRRPRRAAWERWAG